MISSPASHNPYEVTVDSTAPPRILVVDDEPAVLFAYRKLIEKAGMCVDICDCMEDALCCIRSQHYLAVIADMRLAGTDNSDGLEILRNVRHDHPDTITILVTGYGDSDLEKAAQEVGVTRYFKKPVQPTDILASIRKNDVELTN